MLLSSKDTRPDRRTAKADPLDIKIMRMLVEDGNLEYRVLAERLGVDKRTVSKHVEDLKRRNVLKITAEINWQAVGVDAFAFVGTMTALGESDVAKLYEYIREEPRIIEAYSTIGSDEYFLTVLDTDIQTLREEVLRKLEPLTADLSTAIVSTRIKTRDYSSFLAYLDRKTE